MNARRQKGKAKKFLRIFELRHKPLDEITLLWYIVTRGETMEENLITKKELLEITGISYGALYRWKRIADVRFT